jgi:hypothetical protein
VKKILLSIVFLALALPAGAQNYILSIESRTIDTDREIRLPIYLNNSINVGSVQIRLDYNPAVLSAYSDPILDKGDFISFYAPENSHNTSGYIIINAMQFGTALSGNLTIGYVRLQALNIPASSSQIALGIITITDDAGNDLIKREGSGEIKEPAITAIEETPNVTSMELDVRSDAHEVQEVQETQAGTPLESPKAPFVPSTALLLIMLILKYYRSKNKGDKR